MIKMEFFSTAALLLLLLPAFALAAGSKTPEAPQEPEPQEGSPGHEADNREGHGHEAHGHGSHGDQHHHHRHGTDGVHHDFSDVERWAAVFEGDDRDEWQKPEEVIRLLEIEPGMTVADLGAGSGYFLPYLSRAVGSEGKVLGLDPEPNFITYMTARAEENGWENVEARRIPLDDPGLPEGSADRILIVNTWHHIDDRGTYAAKLGRALSEGGRVFVVDFTKESPYGPSVDSRLLPEQVIGELRNGGLEAEQVPTGLPWQYVIIARRP